MDNQNQEILYFNMKIKKTASKVFKFNQRTQSKTWTKKRMILQWMNQNPKSQQSAQSSQVQYKDIEYTAYSPTNY